jgi:hypothetical protein
MCRLPEAVEVLKGAAKMNKKSLPGDEEVQVKSRKFKFCSLQF